MTAGARRQCRLAQTRKNTETHEAFSPALFSSNHWSEESRQVRCEAQQAHGLGHAGPGEAFSEGDLGLTGGLAGLQEGLPT